MNIPRVPSSLEVLRSPLSFDPDSRESITAANLRRLIGQDLPSPVPIDNEAVTAFHVDLLVGRILEKKDTVVVVDGEPGEGKSTYTIGLGARVKNALSAALGKRDQFELEQHVVYRESDLIHQIHINSRENPQVVVSDEGILAGAQARSGTYDASALLDKVLSVSRVKGVTLFVLAPSVWGLASFVRNRRAKLYHHVEWRGLTTAFILKGTISWTPPRELPFNKMRKPWDKIRWESLEKDPIWAPYERRKVAETDSMLAAAELEAIRIEEKSGLRPPAWAEASGYRSKKTSRAEGETTKEWDTRRKRLAYREQRDRKNLRALEGEPRTRARATT